MGDEDDDDDDDDDDEQQQQRDESLGFKTTHHSFTRTKINYITYKSTNNTNQSSQDIKSRMIKT